MSNCCFAPQDGHDYVSEVSVAGYPAVHRQQDSANRGTATETSGGELYFLPLI